MGEGSKVDVQDGVAFGKEVGDTVALEGLDESLEDEKGVNVRPALPEPPVKTMRLAVLELAIELKMRQ